jgi:hypothetical protein
MSHNQTGSWSQGVYIIPGATCTYELLKYVQIEMCAYSMFTQKNFFIQFVAVQGVRDSPNPLIKVFLFYLHASRTEIATLTDKIRRLEIAQANQRRQQAIAMAAMAADKLKTQKLNGDFQSDSNLPYYSSAEYKATNPKPTKLRLAVPAGRRLLLKVHQLLREDSFQAASLS